MSEKELLGKCVVPLLVIRVIDLSFSSVKSTSIETGTKFIVREYSDLGTSVLTSEDEAELFNEQDVIPIATSSDMRMRSIFSRTYSTPTTDSGRAYILG